MAASERFAFVVILALIGATGRLFLRTEGEGVSSAQYPGAYLAMALGDRAVAADLAWLDTVQFVGQQRSADANFPGLEKFIDAITELDPTFAAPYSVAAAFLSSDPKRSKAVDRLLERGQRSLPGEYSIPMARGFVAYFGRQDFATAAAHFRMAATMPLAPGYLSRLAQTLSNADGSCAEVRPVLATLQQSSMLTPSLRSVLTMCFGRRIEAAAATHRLQFGPTSSIDELVARGLLTRPPAPQGYCWQLVDGKASLAECGR